MNNLAQNVLAFQYLLYDFTYEGRRHKGRFRLYENSQNVVMLYDDHNMEVTWIKHIKHKGKYIEINIVVNDNWNDENLGKVSASAWVCVYNKMGNHIIDEFEPDYWAYIDEENPSNNTNKSQFYTNNSELRET